MTNCAQESIEFPLVNRRHVERVSTVVKDSGGKPQSQAYLWEQRVGPSDHRIVLYAYNTPDRRTYRSVNAIRRFVIGSKNFLFCDDVAGARSNTNLYRLIETTTANSIASDAYLRMIFTELPQATSLEEFEALLPFTVNTEK